ncbi:MAG TPA: hypothetical protein PL182_05220 [Pseudobdellovibrionaceae bacterium]|nr:hypothetical protein [Pseudobdellovibrionaceae bacterium]
MTRKKPLSSRDKAIRAIEDRGALLVFPDGNKAEPPSLWSVLHPRSEMRWSWDADGDNRVPKLWVLREELSRSGAVVYSKWYRGRATFFAKDDFTDLLAVRKASEAEHSLRGESAALYEALLESSPQSTKELKRATDLQGRFFESAYHKGMKALFEAGLIVGWGEVDDGAFPSLACGATKVLFEDSWTESLNRSPEEALSRIQSRWNGKFLQFLSKLK